MQLQSHLWLTASSYMTKYLRISSYIRKPFLIYDFATAQFWISLQNFIFLFISVSVPVYVSSLFLPLFSISALLYLASCIFPFSLSPLNSVSFPYLISTFSFYFCTYSPIFPNCLSLSYSYFFLCLFSLVPPLFWHHLSHTFNSILPISYSLSSPSFPLYLYLYVSVSLYLSLTLLPIFANAFSPVDSSRQLI